MSSQKQHSARSESRWELYHRAPESDKRKNSGGYFPRGGTQTSKFFQVARHDFSMHVAKCKKKQKLENGDPPISPLHPVKFKLTLCHGLNIVQKYHNSKY